MLSQDGRLARRWQGTARLTQGAARVPLRWTPPRMLTAGVYTLRLLARSGPEEVEQKRPVAVGKLRPLAVAGLVGVRVSTTGQVTAQATGALGATAEPRDATTGTAQAARPAQVAGEMTAAESDEFDVVLGNLHSQTGHSDGGGAIPGCHGAQEPQSAAARPAEAYGFALRHGLDFLLTSEHNHMYDGSEGTDANADPEQARELYSDGLAQATGFNVAHPGFAALYGMEWGVIANGGHLNILNSPVLLNWERTGAGDVIGDLFAAKGDYGALYTLMRQRGWLGQFNHPAQNQFRVDGKPLAWTEDGDAAMALCEVMNSSAFSASMNEGETRHSFYEDSCNRLLEAGYHIAFSSNQDNHCANWGADYGNRTGVLLPQGTALTPASLLEAIAARRVFATMDKNSLLALTANGHIMGERFDNRGVLTLSIRFASSSGRSVAALEIMEGVPGRNGEVKSLPGVARGETTITPSPGQHFYYARITQDDGRQLWSAPVWVNQLE
ncbi:CehA/McbA family metallohydrolase [Pseudoduganella sp. UC29_106]|uniref:CehA/McbA family metallohydrolase n=1 Tax=Pseudoduganella sp. UC29_106 TaxID=3374553 RepID=UPI003756E965